MKLFSTTALVLTVAATGALADNHSNMNAMDSTLDNTMDDTTQVADYATETKMDSADKMDTAELIRTRDITGGAIYTLNGAAVDTWDSKMTLTEVSDEWTEIGEIEDIVLSKSGEFKGIVAEIGGFLDIGDKHVMISIEDVQLVAIDDQSYAYVTRLSEEELESMEGVDEGFWN